MGEQTVEAGTDPEKRRRFMQQLLDEVQALELMMNKGMFDTSMGRIGAEQEVFFIDAACRPAPVVLDVLKILADDPHFTTELGRFNLEFNLDPIEIGPQALENLHQNLESLYQKAWQAAESVGARLILIGILPTLEGSDLSLDNMTPVPRYFALNDAVRQMRGSEFRLHFKGRDEMFVTHDNVMLEACTTSFQIHLQVSPDAFARLYNIAQAVAAPVLAAGTNSPLLFGKRLWNETRIALFSQAVDTRTGGHRREEPPRVTFGEHWLDDSVLEIFREDIARFRLLISGDVSEDTFAILKGGGIPSLKALRLHNGTVYRWNRPCYGILDGKPHLRIENRVFPAGPSLRDEVANCAFWLGMMRAISDEIPDITTRMSFDAAKENFLSAARLGLQAQLEWLDGESRPARELILEELLPRARQGLTALGIDEASGQRHLDVLEERVRSRRTGARWLLDSFNAMANKGRTAAERLVHLTAAAVDNQRTGLPVHSWPLAEPHESDGQPYAHVANLMTTDLFTVNEDEVVDLAAYIMDWKHVRHVPVENNEHRLVGILTHRVMLRVLARYHGQTCPPIPVREVMKRDVFTVRPDTPTVEAIALMRQNKVGCLPVVEDGRLVGILTERDLIHISAQLLEDFLKRPAHHAVPGQPSNAASSS